jgi:hypothetical protein
MFLLISEWRLIKGILGKPEVMPEYGVSRLRTRNARIVSERVSYKRFTCRFLFDHLREFFLYTSQHGYKYIAQRNGTAVER